MPDLMSFIINNDLLLFICDTQTDMSCLNRTQCVQNFNESLGYAIHMILRILPRSSSYRKPTYFEKFTSFYKDIEFPIFYVQKFIDSHL